MTRTAITVLVPTFRRPKLLTRTLRSLQAQICTDFQVLVFDNASGDSTGDVVRSFAADDGRIHLICRPENLGAIRNIGGAFAAVDTEFCCLVSDDDILLPNCLEVELAGLRSHPRAMAWGGVVITAEGTRARAFKPDPIWLAGFHGPESAVTLICRNSRLETTGLLFRSRMISPAFTDIPAGFMASDVGWLLHAALAGGVGFSDVPTAVFFMHPGAVSTEAMRVVRKRVDLLWPSARHLAEIVDFAHSLPADVRRRCGIQVRRSFGSEPLRQCAITALREGDRETAERIAGILGEGLGDVDSADRVRGWLELSSAQAKRWLLWRRWWPRISNRVSLPFQFWSRLKMRRQLAEHSAMVEYHLNRLGPG